MVMHVHMAQLTGGTIRTAQLRGKLSATLLNAQKRALKYLERYVDTWEHKPFFETKGGTKYAKGDIEVNLITDDQVFWWLEDGTRVRYAVMTEDFVPKTAHRRIDSVDGQGGYAYLDMKNPRPGIQAREILAEIADLEAPRIAQEIASIAASITLFPSSKGSVP